MAGGLFFLYNFPMKELMNEHTRLGLPRSERKRIRANYRGNPSGLREYVLYMRAILDDRHEYR